MHPLLDPPSSCHCSMLPATSNNNNNNDGNLLINISLAINKQINANLGHKLRLWPETVQRKMQSAPASASACLAPASLPCPKTRCNRQLATDHINANALHAAFLRCSGAIFHLIPSSYFIMPQQSQSHGAQSLQSPVSPPAAAAALSISISIAVALGFPSCSSLCLFPCCSLVFVIPILRYDKLCLHFNF